MKEDNEPQRFPHAAGNCLTVIAPAVLLSSFAACKAPTTPGSQVAAITIENVGVTATAPPCCARGPFSYRVSLTISETAGVAATISGVTVTVTEVSGSATVTQLTAADAFGASRIPGHGTLTSTNITSTGPLLTVNEITVRITFTDDNGHAGSADTTTAAKLDLNGDWSGPLPIKTQPLADWSLARVTLVQNGDSLSGDVVSRDGVRFPLTGTVSGDWAPMLFLGGLPRTSTCGGVGLVITQIQFSGGRAQRLNGHASGRCFGTVAGTFELQRAF